MATCARGYNHSLRYRGWRLHVQTEDAGYGHGHIDTHVFLRGRIVASRRLDYLDQRAAVNVQAIVQGLVRDMHREMIRRVFRGELDGELDRILVGEPDA